jgi:hypothetical protein
MKYFLIGVIFFAIFVSNVNSDTNGFGVGGLLISEAASYNISEKSNNFFSLSIGTELIFFNYDIKNKTLLRLFMITKIGMYYRYSFTENNNYLLFYHYLQKIGNILIIYKNHGGRMKNIQLLISIHCALHPPLRIASITSRA